MFGKKSLKCLKCKASNINVQMVNSEMSTKRNSVGLFGHAHNAVRGVASVATLGLAGKVISKAEGKNKTKVKMQKVAICQNCGHSWKLD